MLNNYNYFPLLRAKEFNDDGVKIETGLNKVSARLILTNFDISLQFLAVFILDSLMQNRPFNFVRLFAILFILNTMNFAKVYG